MAKQTITGYDVENYDAIADEYEAGDVVDANEYLELTGNADQIDEEKEEEIEEESTEDAEEESEEDADEEEEDES